MSCKDEKCNDNKINSVNENEEEKEEKEEKEESKLSNVLYVIAIVTFLITFIPIIPMTVKIILYFVTLLLAGYELFVEGIKNIFCLKFEEDTLMTIAAISACALGEFMEACLVILLFRLGEFIEDLAVSKANRNIQEVADLKVETANRLNAKNEEILNEKIVNGETANLNKENEINKQILNNDNCKLMGKIEVIEVEKLKVGDTILIKPGEMVPVDCKILSGTSNLDTSRLTGESETKSVEAGQEILSGNINLSGSLVAEVIREYKDSTASQITDLVYEAINNKGKTEKLITKFSKIYTPTVMIIAILLAVFPIILGFDSKTWITRALVFLVASCPCSIVISIPLAFFSCVGTLSKKGLLVKGTKHIENLAKAKTICFDKTGTITTGKMVIISNNKTINQNDNINKNLFSYLYSLEHLSNHPIAVSIEEYIKEQGWNVEELLQEVSNEEELAGYGIKGNINGKQVLFGNIKLLEKYNISYPKDITKDANYLAVDGEFAGYIVLKEEIRNGTQNLKQDLQKQGIKNIAILTGDNTKKAEKIAQKIGGVKVYAELLPQDKLEKVEELKKQGKVVFVGDGINDSPVLAASDFSISMGEGASLATNTADSILMSNKISSIPSFIKVAKTSMNIIYFNIIFSLLIKLIVLILGIVGIAPIWLAVFADVGVTLITVINSVRIYKVTMH